MTADTTGRHQLRAVRLRDGTEVRRGDMLTSSRSGDEWRFLYATRPTGAGRAGKVLVNPPQYADDGGTEIYASVFGLIVEEETS